MDFQFFALDWIYMVNRPAWDRNFFDWANRVWARFVLRILSMRRTPSILYWVYAENNHFHSEYTQKTIFFILSINWTRQRMMEYRSFHTEYKYEVFLRILSMKMMVFCVYSVWKWWFSAYTQNENDGFLRILSIKWIHSIAQWFLHQS